jgi:excisionase family DNA binding protein
MAEHSNAIVDERKLVASVTMENNVGLLLWDKRETAKALSISVRHLEDLTKEGVIKAVRLGRRALYDPADLRAAIETLKDAPAVKQSRRKQKEARDAA